MYLSYYEGSCDDLSIADVLWERLSEFGIGIMNYKSEYSYMNLEHGPYSREVYGFQQEQEDPDWIQVRDRVAEMSSYGAVVGFEQKDKEGDCELNRSYVESDEWNENGGFDEYDKKALMLEALIKAEKYCIIIESEEYFNNADNLAELGIIRRLCKKDAIRLVVIAQEGFRLPSQDYAWLNNYINYRSKDDIDILRIASEITAGYWKEEVISMSKRMSLEDFRYCINTIVDHFINMKPMYESELPALIYCTQGMIEYMREHS